MSKGKIAVALVLLSMAMIITGIVIEIREMIIDNYCLQLTPYEFIRNKKCEKYRENNYEFWKKK